MLTKVKELLNPKVRLVLFLCILTVLAGGYFIQYKTTEDVDVAIDFPSFYYASKLAFEIELTPYNNSNWKLVKAEYTDSELFPYLYPPPSLIIFSPFISLDYQTAKAFMLGINHILILLFIFVFFFKILKIFPQEWFLFAAAVYLYAFFPLRVTLNNGQVSLWVLLSICLVWWATKEKAHPILISIPLVFGIILKFYPILLLVIFFFRKDYKTIFYVIILLVAVSVISTFFLPEGIWEDWYTQVASRGYSQEIRGVMIAGPGNQSINAFTTRLFYGRNQRFDNLLRPTAWADQVPYILAGIVGIVSLAATFSLARDKKTGQGSIDLQVCIWSLVMFFVSPFSWNYHLVHILPAIYIALLEAINRRNFLFGVITISVALFLAYDFPFNDPFFRRGVWTLLISSQLFAVGILWLYFVFLAFVKREEKRLNRVVLQTSK